MPAERVTEVVLAMLVQLNRGAPKLTVALKEPMLGLVVPPLPLKTKDPPDEGIKPAASWASYNPISPNSENDMRVALPSGPLTVIVPASSAVSLNGVVGVVDKTC